MKLRQKLAVALASAMVITSVPVVTMAASTNTLTKETMHLAKNDITTTSAVKIDFKDSKKDQVEVFYLELENAEWDFSKLAAADGTVTGNVVTFANGIKYEVQSDEIVKVTYTLTSDAQKVHFPIMAEVTGGDAKVSVVSKGGNTNVTSNTFVFATTGDAQAIVTAETKDLPTLYTEGTIADIIITESMINGFTTMDSDEREIEITIDNDEFEFKNTGRVSNDQIVFTYGFAGHNNSASAVSATVYAKDKQTLVVILPNNLKSDSIGQIKIKDLEVKSTSKAPATGDLTVSVDGDGVKSTDSIKVAKVSAYGCEVEIEEDDKVEIRAGEQEEVIFTLKEVEKTSFINGRDVEFTLDKGFFVKGLDEDGNVVDEDNDNDVDDDKTIAELEKIVTLKNEKAALKITDIELNDDDQVIGFTATMIADEKVEDEIEVKAKITAGLQEEGDVTMTIGGRAVAEEIKTVITTITKAFSVNTEAAVLKVGLQGQVAGKITLTEAEKGMFKSGKEIVITIPTEKGLTLKEEPVATTTTGDIQMDKAKVKTTSEAITITIPVKRTSKTASTIEISGFEFTTDRTVAEGTFDVTLGGTALTTVKETMDLEDFIVVGTPNTEDLTAANGLAKGTATFAIGEATYTMNGVTKEMTAKSYIQDPGFTMIPVRYVAEAFGVKANDILFSNGTATIFAGNRTIQLTAGSNVAIVNGAAVTMGTKVAIVEGRTYAPVGEVARILGISTEWDSATKTATFTNK